MRSRPSLITRSASILVMFVLGLGYPVLPGLFTGQHGSGPVQGILLRSPRPPTSDLPDLGDLVDAIFGKKPKIKAIDVTPNPVNREDVASDSEMRIRVIIDDPGRTPVQANVQVNIHGKNGNRISADELLSNENCQSDGCRWNPKPGGLQLDSVWSYTSEFVVNPAGYSVYSFQLPLGKLKEEIAGIESFEIEAQGAHRGIQTRFSTTVRVLDTNYYVEPVYPTSGDIVGAQTNYIWRMNATYLYETDTVEINPELRVCNNPELKNWVLGFLKKCYVLEPGYAVEFPAENAPELSNGTWWWGIRIVRWEKTLFAPTPSGVEFISKANYFLVDDSFTDDSAPPENGGEEPVPQDGGDSEPPPQDGGGSEPDPQGGGGPGPGEGGGEPTPGGSDPGSSPSCDNLLPPVLSVGMNAEITPGPKNTLRDGPGLGYDFLLYISPGDPFLVLDGPICQDGYRWWKVRLSSGVEGWTADGDASSHWIVPSSGDVEPTKPPDVPPQPPGLPEATPPQCSWVNELVGVWYYVHSDHTSLMIFYADGRARYMESAPDGSIYGEHEFLWDCEENYVFENITEGTTYLIKFLDRFTLEINDDIWQLQPTY